MKTPRFLVAACVSLALAFTFSCSSDDDSDSPPAPVQLSSSGGGSSSSDGAQAGISYGVLSYEGKDYKTVKIGNQTWMAENMNCEVNGSACYDDEPANCDDYGRLYTWDAAISVCPIGWHLPSDDDWNELMDEVGGTSVAGTMLKKTSGWDDEDGDYIPGTDEHGFSALPGGVGSSDGDFGYAGVSGLWWSSSDNEDDAASPTAGTWATAASTPAGSTTVRLPCFQFVACRIKTIV